MKSNAGKSHRRVSVNRTGPPRDWILFTTKLERSTNKLWGCHFRVPGAVAQRLIGDGSRRVVCRLNGSAAHQRAILPHGEGSFVITVNRKIRDQLGLSFGAEVQVGLKKDDSQYGLPVPEELRELFRQDAGGNALFHALTLGKQRTLLYIVGSVKSPAKRAERAVTVIRHLKANAGKINYRQLYTSLKGPRH